jgi:hypothetical protein
MKRRIVAILLTLTLSTLCVIEDPEAGQMEVDIEYASGYRVDHLDWNIAGNEAGTNPTILSEVTWNDLGAIQVSLGTKALINRSIYLRGSLGSGRVLSGDNQDSDFHQNHGIQEYARSNNKADDGSVWDATAAFGYQFRSASDRFRLSPLAGFSYRAQNLTMTEGYQTLSTPEETPPIGPIEGLDSTYDTQWYGPWIGVDLLFEASKRFGLFAGVEHHWTKYKAEGNWNLRDDLAHPKSFEHEADGTGFLIALGGHYVFPEPSWSLGLEMNYVDWTTDPGIDRQFKPDDSVQKARLNRVNWDSLVFMMKLTYRFDYFFPW